jgi:hypothetical protein
LVLFVRIGTFQRVVANPNYFFPALPPLWFRYAPWSGFVGRRCRARAVDGLIHSRAIVLVIRVFSKAIVEKWRRPDASARWRTQGFDVEKSFPSVGWELQFWGQAARGIGNATAARGASCDRCRRSRVGRKSHGVSATRIPSARSRPAADRGQGRRSRGDQEGGGQGRRSRGNQEGGGRRGLCQRRPVVLLSLRPLLSRGRGGAP